MLRSRIVKFLVLTHPILIASSCSTRINKRHARQGPETSILAVISGIAEDEPNLERFRYELSCEALAEPLVGQRVSNEDSSVLSFSNDTALDGDQCSLKIRGPADETISWLSTPNTIGLYYASEAAVVVDGKLELKLFKVYRIEAGPERASLVVKTTDEGECESFDLNTAKCSSANPDKPEPTQPLPIEPEPEPEPVPEPEPSPPIVPQFSFTDWIGITNFFDTQERPKVSKVAEGSWADKSNLMIEDTITLIDTTIVTNLSTLNEAIKAIKLDSGRTSDITINVIRGNTNEILLLTAQNRPSN